MVYTDEQGAASFVSFTRVVGRLGERSGAFALQGSGSYADGTASGEWLIVPDSASGELTACAAAAASSRSRAVVRKLRWTMRFEE